MSTRPVEHTSLCSPRIDAPLCKRAGKIPSGPTDLNLVKDLTAYQTDKRIVMTFLQNVWNLEF